MASADHTATIMVIDDDADIRDVVGELLEQEGYRVMLACNGEDGLDQLREGHRPTLILLDRLMPGMDGEAVLEELAKDDSWRRIPVVMFSAYTENDLTDGSTSPWGYLTKPIDLDSLLSAVARFCAMGDVEGPSVSQRQH